MFNPIRVTLTGTLCLTLAAALPSLQAAPRTAPAETEKQVLQDLRARALAVRADAETLRTYIEAARLPSDSHARILQALRDDVNRMGKDLVTLDSERNSLPPWEKNAFQRILPLSQDTASTTRQAIDFFNANKTHLWGTQDLGFATRIGADALQIANTAGDYLKYEKLRNEESKIQSEIGHVPSPVPQSTPGE